MLKGLNGVCCYLDDILVTGRNAEEHLMNLEALLKRLLERGVRIKKEKCAFFQNELCYLGHKISAAGISASPEKIEAVVNAATPTNKQQLQSFLGVVNYYGKFVPNLNSCCPLLPAFTEGRSLVLGRLLPRGVQRSEKNVVIAAGAGPLRPRSTIKAGL